MVLPFSRLACHVGSLIVLILGSAGDLAAQRSIYPPSNTASVQAGQSGAASFQLVNNDPTNWNAEVSCIAEGVITSCSVDPASAVVLGFSEQEVAVTFTTEGEGTGVVRISADGLEAVLEVTVTPAQPLYAVSPDGPAVSALPGRERRDAFTVANNSPQALYISLVASCSGSGIDATICTTSASRLFLRSGESSPVTVRYSTLPAAGTGTVVLRALTSGGGTVLDTGYVSVTVSAPPLAIVQIAPSTTGVTVEKDQCAKFSLRREAAAACGVLRIAHQLPGVRTRAAARVPTLLYYYDLAYRQRTVGVDVTMAPATTHQTGDSVRVSILQRASGQCVNPVSKTYSAAHWFTGTPGARSRRVSVSVPLESSGDSYIRQYCVDVVRVRAGGPQALAPVQFGEFAVVQRYNTAFGAGWWLAGLEELYLSQPDSIGGANAAILWIGGDGSTRRYRCRATGCNGVYASADLIDRPDSLVLSGGEYTRYLPHGVKVVFDYTGRHVRTISQHGAITTFAYSGTARRLLTITVPPTGSGLSYTFVYDGSNSLIRVDAPGVTIGTVRSVTLQRSGLAVTGFVDPDTKAVTFLPPAPGTDATLIERVVDRRGVGTDFYQEAGSPTVGSVRTVLGAGSEQWQYFRTPSGLSARPVSVEPVPDSVGEAYLKVTDGRGNITRFWLDRLGFPTTVVNAVGNTARVERGDPRFAGLATNMVGPNGHTVSASYDEHGNILANYDISPLGNTQDAVTRYHWDLQWDFVDSVVTPVGLVTTMDYDNSNGNLAWQQTGPDASRRVNFQYYTSGAAAGLPKGTVLPATPADSLGYDALGNPSAYTTSMGFLTQYFNDAIGRTTQTWQQVDVTGTARTKRTVVQYDVMSRDTLTAIGSSDPAVPTVAVRRTLNAAGDDSVVTRWSMPDTTHIGNMVTRTFRDALGRPVKEVAPDGHADSTVYDLVGNVIKTFNRNGDSVAFAYDSLNRLRRRATASKHFNPEVIGLARGGLTSPNPVEAAVGGQQLSQTYPWGQPSGYDVPAQVDTFAYHPTDGTLTDANNAFAKVRFEYYPNGMLRFEQNSQGPWDGGAGPWHTYQNTATLDLAGRRTALGYPSAISGGGSGVTYSYTPFGDLGSIAAFSPFVTAFTTDSRGQLQRRDFPGGSSQTFTYDNDGRLTSDTVKVGSSFVRAQRFTSDARGLRTRMTDIVPGQGDMGSDTSTYDLLGQLTSSTTAVPNVSATSNYTLDAFGNMAKRSGAEASIAWVNGFNAQQTTSNNGEEWNVYRTATGRLWYTKHVPSPDTTGRLQGGGGRPAMMNWYDNAGNLIWTGMAILRLEPDLVKAEAQSERRMYYGPDGKLRAVEARALYKSPSAPANTGAPGFSRSFEEYRYDALGRRVATRFDQACDYLVEFNLYNAPCHVNGIRRTIWDGSQELGEIQLPTEQLENDNYLGQGTFTSSSINLAPFYGAVAYAYDGRIDQPIAIKRLRYSNLTPSNTIVELAAFTYNPVWNVQGTVPYVVGTGSLPASVCSDAMAGGTRATCLSWVLQRNSLAYRDVSTVWPRAWQGTLLQDKVGAGGLLYRRNRYYDSKSGRFTQEDPIGLAGGLNLYGYANGDPINLRDPFGLSADTIRADETTAPYVEQCGASSARCKSMIDSLNKLPADWKVVAGAAGACAPYKVGCVSYNDRNDATAGGTITLVPSDFGDFSFFVNGTAAVGHELGHVVTRGNAFCRTTEACAIGIERIVRAQAGLPPRP